MKEMGALRGLEPAEVMYYFERLSDMPRGSRNEKQVSDYVADFARERGLEYHQDDMYNILVKKPGTPGYEDAPTVILHGHLDMVCKKDDGVEHDFSNEGVKLKVNDDFVEAEGTSLGADNGLGISYMLALLDSGDIPHPPLEAVMTVMEEMGKVGGANFDVGLLSGKRMIDFNWIAEEQLLAGCAGDVSCEMRLSADWERPEQGLAPMELEIKGLKGGHCEFDIHLERANAIVMLSRVLGDVLDAEDLRIANVSGGVQNNTIPAEARATVLIEPSRIEAVKRIVEQTGNDVKNEYQVADPGLDVTATRVDAQVPRVFSVEAARKLTRFISLVPNGVQSWSLSIESTVECSNNIGIMTTDDNGVTAVCTITSSVTTRKHDVLKRILRLAELAGGGVTAEKVGTDAPEFPYNENSEMLDICKKSYARVMGRKPEVLVAVCSLELGMFTQGIPGLDTIGIGTELHDLHSPKERMNHRSAARVWPLIQDVMKSLDS